MTQSPTDEWEDYYAKPENFARLFHDYSELKNKPDKNRDEYARLKAVMNVIEGKFTV